MKNETNLNHKYEKNWYSIFLALYYQILIINYIEIIENYYLWLLFKYQL